MATNAALSKLGERADDYPDVSVEAKQELDKITPVIMRKIVNDIQWTSPVRRKNPFQLVTTIFSQAMRDELVTWNPDSSIPPSRVTKRELDAN